MKSEIEKENLFGKISNVIMKEIKVPLFNLFCFLCFAFASGLTIGWILK